jgi:hypothetical protein
VAEGHLNFFYSPKDATYRMRILYEIFSIIDILFVTIILKIIFKIVYI